MYGARKASLKIVFFKHICAFFSVRGNIGAICSFDNPDPDSDTEGSTRTMRLLKLHYHQQQVSSWSLFLHHIRDKQTNKKLFSFGLMYQCLHGVITSRKCSITAYHLINEQTQYLKSQLFSNYNTGNVKYIKHYNLGFLCVYSKL